MKGIMSMPPRERLMANVSMEPFSGCWLWTGGLNDAGYGILRIDGHLERAHRISYLEFIGPIPEGLEPDHTCRVRCCISPHHLEPVTHRVNCARSPIVGPGIPHAWSNGRAERTHCPRGHAYDEVNTYYGKVRGERLCRSCAREKAREQRNAA